MSENGPAGIVLPENVALELVNIVIVPEGSVTVLEPENVLAGVIEQLTILTRVLSQALKLALISAIVATLGVTVLPVLFRVALVSEHYSPATVC